MLDKKSQKNFERALLHEMEKIKIAARQWHASGTITMLRATGISVARRLSPRASLRLLCCA